MSFDTLAAPSPFAIDIANDFGVLAEALDWNTADWAALNEHIKARVAATGKRLDEMTLYDLQSAVWASGPKGAYVSHVHCLIGQDDTVRHDLFRVARKLLRIYDLRMIEMVKLFGLLERCPGTIEDLTVRNLMALISIVDWSEKPEQPSRSSMLEEPIPAAQSEH